MSYTTERKNTIWLTKEDKRIQEMSIIFSKTKRIKKRKRIPIFEEIPFIWKCSTVCQGRKRGRFLPKNARTKRLAFCFNLFRISRLKGKSRVDDDFFFFFFVSLSKSKASFLGIFASFLHFPAIFISLCLEVVLKSTFVFMRSISISWLLKVREKKDFIAVWAQPSVHILKVHIPLPKHHGHYLQLIYFK